mmetsp:Transcript_85547/g.169771  ORF Transcript_85547/g.169771 Transcript_85547/m.169771 type:complete len:203 (-) Transcript_85547:664-1272(-)
MKNLLLAKFIPMLFQSVSPRPHTYPSDHVIEWSAPAMWRPHATHVASRGRLHAKKLGLLRCPLLPPLLPPGNGTVHQRLEDLLLLRALARSHADNDALWSERAVKASLQEVRLALWVNANIVEAVVPATQSLVAAGGESLELLPELVVNVCGALPATCGHCHRDAPAVCHQFVFGGADGVLLRKEVLQARQELQRTVRSLEH